MNERLMTLALVIVSGAVIFWRMNERFVWFTDELLFEEASYRIASSSQTRFNAASLGENIDKWMVPSLSDVPVWVEKPPLYFWMTAPLFWVQDRFVKVMQLNEVVMPDGGFALPWIRRFWTMAAGVGMVWLTTLIGKRMFGTGIGLLAGVLLLATPLFLATTKAASMDMVAGFWVTGAMYFYLKSKEELTSIPALVTKRSSGLSILCGLCLGLAVMTRSFLGLIPLLVIAIDLTVSKFPASAGRRSLQVSKLTLTIIAAGLVALPWHGYVWWKYPEMFREVYLKFNLIGHGLSLAEGYEETKPWFYVWTLLEGNAWLLPVVITAGVGWGFLKLRLIKKWQAKITMSEVSMQILNQVQDDNKKNVRFLWIWFLVPMVGLSLAATRHEWYAIQALPPLAILMAQLTRWTYRVIACPNCAVVKYLSQIIFITLVLASILSVLSIEDPSAESVKALRWLSENTKAGEVVYSYKRDYLPNTLLYRPRLVKVINYEQLIRLIDDNEKSYVYVAEQDWKKASEKIKNFEEVKSYKNGRVVAI